jgi:hypothetical protein
MNLTWHFLAKGQVKSNGLPQVIYQFWLAIGFPIKTLACHVLCKARVFFEYNFYIITSKITQL